MVNVLLIGIGTTTLTALESLISQCHVQGIVRYPDTDDPVANLAQKANIPIFTDTSQTAIKVLILKFQPDCVVVSSYNQILPPALIELSTFINVHYSPLPQYRGRANVNWAIINDEPCAAISIHKISPDLDEGNIFFQQLIPIHRNDTVADLYDRLNEIQKQNLGEIVVKALNGYPGVQQNNAEATYSCTRLPEDGEINWSASTRSIDCLIRALVAPFPGAYTYFQGKKLTIWQAQPVDNPPVYVGRIPGRIINRSKTDGFVDVLNGDGVLRIFTVQLTGEEKTAAANIIKSVKTTLGLQTSDLLNRIQLLEAQINQLQENAK
ncbi:MULTISPECIES: methionyl-tRNA formyltransferase [unclassified Tolypothrix]|uniref:methionyl-tRNA formyltransferase n=1 Tax=unclassified Tolypothrix TaxID=2649714 RepID=UPI0005EAC1E2|nr:MULTISPECIES: methionyl-tRNA formyltransferase [unclassified Tolypothrix]BAY94735.1 methionyl-tRNA formyltransferase [Microchaete diplosiphon NIES-3275]EKE99030.1 formyl transferase protein [Tolypothrix sp. PCC 7601]MBE9081356.1 methionyl-tRNA formyltransferase [Tolypothrix sp. LEGE 11397]UYD28424.1 methionyl-tRNA formyltransferase [Tolypothrix sp. PCC 7712]UYD35697.1 methionyl-tRNA formyltransferase [Tolypothrix sp. PCC 7601]